METMPELIVGVEKYGVWVLKATENYCKLDFSKILS